MKIKSIVTSVFAAASMSVSAIGSVATANAWDFATKDSCDVVSCAGEASGYVTPVPSGAGAQDFAMMDLTPVKIETLETTEIAAMETDGESRHSSSGKVPSGSTLYDWSRVR